MSFHISQYPRSQSTGCSSGRPESGWQGHVGGLLFYMMEKVRWWFSNSPWMWR